MTSLKKSIYFTSRTIAEIYLAYDKKLITKADKEVILNGLILILDCLEDLASAASKQTKGVAHD